MIELDTTIVIGPFHEGEIPAPLTHTFTDVDLTGYTAKAGIKRFGDVVDLRDITIDLPATDGKATFVWAADDLAEPGAYEVQLWVGNGTNRFASPVHTFTVAPSIAVPDI
jgi:hypothetical protein